MPTSTLIAGLPVRSQQRARGDTFDVAWCPAPRFNRALERLRVEARSPGQPFSATRVSCLPAQCVPHRPGKPQSRAPERGHGACSRPAP